MAALRLCLCLALFQGVAGSGDETSLVQHRLLSTLQVLVEDSIGIHQDPSNATGATGAIAAFLGKMNLTDEQREQMIMDIGQHVFNEPGMRDTVFDILYDIELEVKHSTKAVHDLTLDCAGHIAVQDSDAVARTDILKQCMYKGVELLVKPVGRSYDWILSKFNSLPGAFWKWGFTNGMRAWSKAFTAKELNNTVLAAWTKHVDEAFSNSSDGCEGLARFHKKFNLTRDKIERVSHGEIPAEKSDIVNKMKPVIDRLLDAKTATLMQADMNEVLDLIDGIAKMLIDNLKPADELVDYTIKTCNLNLTKIEEDAKKAFQDIANRKKQIQTVQME